MNGSKLLWTMGTFALGVVAMAAVGFFLISSGFLSAPDQNAAAPIPVETVDTHLSQNPVAQAGPPQGDRVGEGIKVRGDWTIEVYDPDATLVSHTEFENSLVRKGERRIADILARRMLPRYWGVRLRGVRLSVNTLSNSPCINSAGEAWRCVIYEPQGIVSTHTSNNLVVTSTTHGILRLTGSIIAQRDGQITSVTTLHNSSPCAEGVTFPDDCAGSAGTEVTDTRISPAIDVFEGQRILATVEISFE